MSPAEGEAVLASKRAFEGDVLPAAESKVRL